MRPVYGRSPWVDRFPKSRVPSRPTARGEIDTDVVVIGGGLTGCLTAYALAVAGLRVVVVEADRVGRGASSAASGWITDTAGQSFIEMEARLGRRAARHAWQAWRRAALDLEALIRRLAIRCYLVGAPALLVAHSVEQASQLARERTERGDAGIEGSLLTARTVGPVTGFPATAALRTRDGAVVDPYRLTLGMAKAAADRGAVILERSPATRTRTDRDGVTVDAGGARLRAQRVVVATGEPDPLFPALARHVVRRTTFQVLTDTVPAKVRRSLGSRDHLIEDRLDPPHRISWVDDERVLIGGADSDPVAAKARPATLVQRTGQLMYELSTFYPEMSGLQPSHGWDVPYVTTATGLPLIGPHRNYPRHLFAFGSPSRSLTASCLASRLLVRQHLGETQAGDDIFGFSR